MRRLIIRRPRFAPRLVRLVKLQVLAELFALSLRRKLDRLLLRLDRPIELADLGAGCGECIEHVIRRRLLKQLCRLGHFDRPFAVAHAIVGRSGRG